MKSPQPAFRLYCLLTLVFLYSLNGQASAANCNATYTHTANGGSTTYNLSAGQSLKIGSGTFTGYIDALPAGSSICVETGATFSPGGFNNISGSLINHGTATLQSYVYNTGTVIDNYGTMTLNGLNTNGAITFRNRANATMNIPYNFQLGLNSTMVNDGLLVAGEDFNTEQGTTLTNNHRLELEGNFNPDGKFDNYGRVYAKAFMNINLNSDVTNYCTLVSWGGFNNNSPLMDNQGTILITTATGAPGGLWQNNKPFKNGSSAKIAGGDFTNNDSFTGGGQMIFSGFTRNNGAFTGNSSSDKITFYDETQTGTQMFDVEGVASVNTVRATFTRPTELDAPSNCSTSYKNFANPVVNDYGDAPASYGDTAHTVITGIQLGALAPDAEAASQYSFNASADGAEDDGAPHPVSPDGPSTAARFPVLQANASSYSSPFTVTNTTGTAGKLYGWIDFDKSGTFEADEAATVNVPTGSNKASVNLNWGSIPADIKFGTTFIRLRLTTDASVTTATPTGNANNGEVEDYPIAIYQPVPANSTKLNIISGLTPATCKTTVFSDNFNDLGSFNWGAETAGGKNIRNWIRAGGGTDTYADVEDKGNPQYSAVYFGNGTMRGIYPPVPNGFTYDANGKLTSPLTAIALRDVADDLGVSHWGPNPVTLSTSVTTVVGKTYRMYFKAIPETDAKAEFSPGIMRVDITGSSTESIHFKAPGSKEVAQDYAIEFTATATTSTITFVNYGHVTDKWCDPQTTDWCSEGGLDGTLLSANELIIDDVVVGAVDDCDPPQFPTNICGKTVDNPLELDFSGTATLVSGTAKQPGSVYRFSNVNTGVDALVTLNALQADTLPRWLDGDLGGQLQGAQAEKFFDMTVNLVKSGTSTAITPVDLVLNSFDVDGSAGEPYSDGIEYFSPAATFTGAGSKLQASDMGGSIRYTLPLSARGVDDPTAVDPAYAAGAVYNDVTSFRTKGLVVEDNGSSTRSIFIYANATSFKQFGALTCDSQVNVSAVSGIIFEDVNYGGGAGRPFGTAGTVGITGVRVELYNTTGQFLASTTTTAGGNYSFGVLPDGNYYVRVVNDSISSSRTGSNGSELAVQTYRRNDVTAVTTEIGGRKPSVVDAPANATNLPLNTSNFTFTGGGQAQSVQPVTIIGGDVSGVSFGFNVDTIVNANDSGQGSLRQFLLNANLLGGDASLAQTGRTAGKENALLALPTTDPGYNSSGVYWSIGLKSALPDITSPLVLDSSLQTGFINQPVLELNGQNAGAGVNGLTLTAGGNGSSILNLAINRFAGSGIYVNGSSNNTLQANRIGTDPNGSVAYTNLGSGILLDAASNNLIGGTTSGTGNIIANNSSNGITITGAASANNSILGNSVHSNFGLGIDLGNNGVTTNDAGDTDTGPNNLLNYPAVHSASFGANGSRIITYDFSLDLPANANGYRLEFFKNAAKDPSGNGEGQTFLGSKDFTHPGSGTLNFKGSFNANQAVSSGEFIAITVTEKTGATTFGNTSEFSGAANNNTALVCTDLISGTGADMVIDENATTVTYLKAKDSSGNPVTYVISGGVDASMFTVVPPVNGTIDCSQIQFVKSLIIKDAPAEPRVIIPGGVDPGNFEIPLDRDKDNVYDLEITATDSKGQKYVRTLSLRVMDVNEAPIITSSATVSVEEDGSTLALDINSQDQDSSDKEGAGLSYTLSGGTDQDKFTLDSATGVLNFKAIPDHDAPADSNHNNVYEVSVTVTDRGGLTATKTFTITITNKTADDGVKLQARALLQGAYDSKSGLMSAELNTLGLLPDNQPYQLAPFNHNGTETLGAIVRESTGHDTAVDWALVELRSSPTTVISARAAILQQDGDLVDAQTGSTTLHFASVTSGNYYVTVRHRNHLGVITASPVNLDSTEKLVDFSLASTAVKGTESRFIAGKLALLWVGDINRSNTLTASGPGNDTTSLLSTVITSEENPNAYTNYTLQGYLPTDLNMDGKTLFSGPNNDANTLIGNVIMHPLNSNFAANFIVKGGM